MCFTFWLSYIRTMLQFHVVELIQNGILSLILEFESTALMGTMPIENVSDPFKVKVNSGLVYRLCSLGISRMVCVSKKQICLKVCSVISMYCIVNSKEQRLPFSCSWEMNFWQLSTSKMKTLNLIKIVIERKWLSILRFRFGNLINKRNVLENARNQGT